jgi:WhiB family transcriptional regulator, redox-sensing transcriptional regulator
VICAPCPARRECLVGALQRHEPCGVWGGEILLQGRLMQFKRGRGRPRIHLAATDACAPLKYT